MQENDFQKNNKELSEKIDKIRGLWDKPNLKEESRELIFEFISLCDVLVTKEHSLYQKNENGEYLPLTKNHKEELLNTYNQISEKIVSISINNDIKGKAQAIFETTKFIENFISKDIRTLIKVNTEDKTLPEIINDARSKEIKIDKDKVDKVGNNMNVRMIIEDGNGSKKVFTAHKYYESEKTLETIKQKYLNSYPEFKKFFEPLCNAKGFSEIYEGIKSYQLEKGKPIVNLKVLEEKSHGAFNYMLQHDLLGLFATLGDRYKDKFYSAFYAFCDDANKENLERAFMHVNIETGKDEPLDERNSAMSVVTELLNQNDLVVHTEKGFVEIDGKKIEGTIMDYAEGKDLFNNLDPNDPAYDAPLENYDTPSLKKQLADLQIIDYICGNFDRHTGNMFFKFDENNKCIGIQGIDNDSSFTTNESRFMHGVQNIVGLADLNVISESMANKIKSITPSMFLYSLEGIKISEKAKNYALKKIVAIQTILADPTRSKIVDKPEDLSLNNMNTTLKNCKINIVPDDKWDKFPLQTLANLGKSMNQKDPLKNIYDDIVRVPGDLTKRRKSIGNENKDYTIAQFNFDREIGGNGADYTACIDKLSNATKLIRGTSPQYEKVKTVLKELVDFQKQDNSKKKNSEKFEWLKQKTDEVKKEINTYIQGKQDLKEKGTKLNTYTENRIKVMNEVSQLLDEKLQRIQDCGKQLSKTKQAVKTKYDYLQKLESKRTNILVEETNTKKTDIIDGKQNGKQFETNLKKDTHTITENNGPKNGI